MKKHVLLFAVMAVFGFTACEKQLTEDNLLNESQNAGVSVKSAHSERGSLLNFTAHLTGSQEVPSNNSKATGQAVFKLNKAGDELYYRLSVAHLEDVRMAHIHLAPAGQNGPVVVWLYPADPPPVLIPGFFSGILQEGVITADDLVGVLAGSELSDLIDLMKEGSTYVNVHTVEFAGGEIRGQISANGLVD